MKYKGLLLDIDNTLYDYNKCHNIALEKVVSFLKKNFSLDNNTILETYKTSRKSIHIELKETASSHNRLLYFQKMLELLNINSLKYSLELYDVYWNSFLESILPFEGVYDLLNKYKGNICLVTDLTAHIQHRKIKILKLNKYCNFVVTSEEAGKEKPHPYPFMLALNKLNIKPHEACMIGDSLNKDIIGANNLNINSIWLNTENKKNTFNINKTIEVKSFNEILKHI